MGRLAAGEAADVRRWPGKQSYLAHRCVVKMGKALLDCCGFAGSAQLSVGVIARMRVRPEVSRRGPGAHNHETFPPGKTLQLVSATRLSTAKSF